MFKSIALTCFIIASLFSLQNAQPFVLPLTGSGGCTESAQFTIKSIADLKSNIKDIECIFAAGLAPDAIGLGFNYGTVLMGDNAIAIQPLAAPFYQGDYVVKTTCKQQTVHLGTLKVAGISVGTAPWTLAPFTEATAPGEAPINPKINNIVMDFRQNIQDVCPMEDEAAMLNAKGFLPFTNPLPPVNCFVDIARVVGRDPTDNGVILLAKGLNNNPQRGWQTSLIYALKNFDPAVKPDFRAGTKLVVPATFTYVHQGFVPVFRQFGATGLVPFLAHSRQNIMAALSSNPFVAALAMSQTEPDVMQNLFSSTSFGSGLSFPDLSSFLLEEKRDVADNASHPKSNNFLANQRIPQVAEDQLNDFGINEESAFNNNIGSNQLFSQLASHDSDGSLDRYLSKLKDLLDTMEHLKEQRSALSQMSENL